MSEIYKITVSGRVQGVGFRFYTMAVARKCGVAGWVRNLPNGDVEVLARIPEGKKPEFLQLVRKGPPASMVRDLRIQSAPETGDCPATGFELRR